MTSFQDALRSTAADTVVFLANKEVDLKARFSKHVDMVQDSNYGVEQLAAELKAMDDSDTSPRKFTNAVVVLKNAHGDYVSTNDKSFGRSPNTASWEHWRLEPVPGHADRVYVRSATHNYGLSASDNKRDVGASANRSGWEEFVLRPAATPGRYHFRSAAFGTNLSQSDTGALSQSANSAAWEQFEVGFASLFDEPGHKKARLGAELQKAKAAEIDKARRNLHAALNALAGAAAQCSQLATLR